MTNIFRNDLELSSVLSRHYYFLIAFVLIFTFAFLKFPSLSYHAEVWAETGTKFFYYALDKSLLINLNKSDYGYLPLLPRLISLLLVKVLGIKESFPLVAQIIGLLFIAFFSAFINLKYFRVIIPSDVSRFVLSLAIGLIPDYELYTFINFTYFGFILCLLILCIQKDTISKPFYFFILFLAFLSVTSKATYMIFLPVYGSFFCYYLYKKNKSESFFYAILLLGIFIQLLFIFFHRHESYRPPATEALPLHVMIDKTLYSFWTLLVTVFLRDGYPTEISIPGLNFIVFLLILILFIFLMRKLFLQKKYMPIVFFISCICLILAAIVLNVIAFKTFYYNQSHTLNWYYFQSVPLFRWTIFPFLAGLLGIYVILANVIPFRIISFMIAVFMSINFSLDSFAKTKDEWVNSHSNWQSYKHLLKEKNYYIPINPAFPWAIKHNTIALEDTVSHRRILSGKKLLAVLLINDPPHLPSVLNIAAYDSSGKKWINAQRLDSGKHKSYFYCFPQTLSTDSVRYTDEKGEKVFVNLKDIRLIVLGKDKEE